MKPSLTLIPAYGRDYKSAAEVKKAWNSNKDFIVSDINSPWDGKYVNKQDYKDLVIVYYQSGRRVVEIY